MYKIFLIASFKLIKLINKLFLIFGKNDFLVRVYANIQSELYINKKIEKNNVSFYVPSRACLLRVESLYTKESGTIDWINKFHNDKKIIFWDIGANIGLYSIYAAIKHNNIDITSFEPSTSNLRVLSRNISINKLFEKIKIFQPALTYKKNQFLKLNESSFKEGSSNSTFGENFDYSKNLPLKIQNKYKIFGTSISYLLKENILEIPNYIKIDVDGIEHLIIRGADNFLGHKNLKEILVELNKDFKKQYDEVFNTLEKNNFILKAELELYDNYNKKSKQSNYHFIKKNS